MPESSREPQPATGTATFFCSCKAYGHSHPPGRCPRHAKTEDGLCFVCAVLINDN